MAKPNQLYVLWHRTVTFLIYLLARYVLGRRSLKRFLVLLGGPGAGKGTLAKLLTEALGLAHLGMGDVLRRKDIQEEFGEQLAEMKRGGLVKPTLVLEILARELTKPIFAAGAILDGVPRSLEQALLLERMLAWQGCRIERAILLEVDEDELVERLAYRLTCSNESCGRTFHLKNDPPKDAGICDACKGKLTQRADDANPEAIRERLRKYRVESKPLCMYYQGRKVLVVVKPTRGSTRQDVFSQVMSALQRA